MEYAIPETQYAVQLVGPDRLEINRKKPVITPTGHQVLAKVEACGLCFSDLKLLKQFSDHARKGRVEEPVGVTPEDLAAMPQYVPGDAPTVPGHEACIRIVAVGESVSRHAPGDRALVQTDYRWLKLANSNASFGYNFEGALQEYVLMDERVIVDPRSGDKFMIAVPEGRSASSIGLIEPWACVEDSYVGEDRRTVLPDGKLLIVAEAGHDPASVDNAVETGEGPAEVIAVYADPAHAERLAFPGAGLTCIHAPDIRDEIAGLADHAFDDIIYFGADPDTVERLNDKLAAGGIINVVLGGKTLGRDVNISVGRMHYGLTRWIGTPGTDAGTSYAAVPPSGEFREGDRVLVIGAAGPMGQMHVIRALTCGIDGVSVVGTDLDGDRLAVLESKVRPIADNTGAAMTLVNPQENAAAVAGGFDYYALMVPAAHFVADAIEQGRDGAIINIFAGIPAGVKQPVNLDRYIAGGMYLLGTSGSVLRDMYICRDKVIAGTLDTDLSVDAVCGIAGAVAGIREVENRGVAGKIVVYPELRDMELIRLAEMADRYPTVAEKLSNGCWNPAAESELLRVAGSGL